MRALIFLAIISVFSYTDSRSGLEDSTFDSSLLPTPKPSLATSGEDTLNNYVYVIIERDGVNLNGNATGFFIRKNDRLYLVSNYHVMANQNTQTKKKDHPDVDSITIVYKVTGQLYKRPLTLSVRQIRHNSKPYFFWEYPDVYAYDVTSKMPRTAIIYSIEKFINKSFTSHSSNDSILCIGYGGDLSGGLPMRMKFKESQYPYDEINIIHAPTKQAVVLKNSYLLLGQTSPGMSGAPVFYMKNGVVTFGGIVSSHIPNLNATIIVKPQEVISSIDANL